MSRTVTKGTPTSLIGRRIVWHPRVHRDLYGSSCYYFAVRLRNPFGAAYSSIRNLITEHCQIVSPAIYEVYGFFDYLIRFWSRPEKKDAFAKALKTREDVHAIMECCYQEVRYFWWDESGKPALPSNLVPFQSDINIANGRIFSLPAEQLEEDPNIAASARKGLLQLKTRSDESRVKFYILVSASSIIPLNMMENLRERLDLILEKQIEKGDLQDVSLYGGSGTGSDMVPFLLKAEVGTFDGIRLLADELSDAIKSTDFRTTTLLVKQTHMLGQEILDTSPKLSPPLEAFEKRIGTELRKQLSHLSERDRFVLSSVLVDYASLFETDGGEHNPILSLASAFILVRTGGKAVERGETLLTMALTFLFKLEGYLRQFFIRTCASKLGPTWFQDIQSCTQELNIVAKKDRDGRKTGEAARVPKPVSDYTLHDTLATLDKLVKDEFLPAGEVEESLGLNWAKKLQSLIETRNELAHGRTMIAHLNDPNSFDTFARKVLDGAAILENLKDAEGREVEL